MVFQSFNLFENLNVLENTIVAQTTVLKRDRETAEKVAKENLEKVGMGSYIGLLVRNNFQEAKNNGLLSRVPFPWILMPSSLMNQLPPWTLKWLGKF